MPRFEETSETLFESVVTAPQPTPLIDDAYISEVLPPTGEAIDIHVDKEQVALVLGRLVHAFTNNLPPYNQDHVRLPQDPRHMPQTLERGGRDHANFLFNVCYYMRGGIKSNDAFKRMGEIYDEWPELYDTEIAKDFQQDEIVRILSDHGLGFQKTVAGQWVKNAQRLHDKYDGDPRNIYDGVDNYEAAVKLTKNHRGEGFIGFREKMTSMILYYLMYDELIEPFNFPVPVDLHVMRISVANELVKMPDVPNGTNLLSPDLLATLRNLYFDYGAEHNVNPLQLSGAVWTLSESSCGSHPGNITQEPDGREARNGRATRLIPGVVDLQNPNQQRDYAAACGVCPIEDTCKWNIPGKQYYVNGSLIIRGERQKYPEPTLKPELPPAPTLF